MSYLDEKCLVLNRNWQAVTFLSVRTCIVTAMRDQACIVHPETFEPLSFERWLEVELPGARYIQTTGTPVAVPSLVVLKKYGERPPRRVNLTRPNLWHRDEEQCAYCGVDLPLTKMTIDHVTPRASGGQTIWENVVAACADCNSRKADSPTPKAAGMRLKKQPHAPRWSPKLLPPKGAMDPLWAPFLKYEGVE